MKLFLSHASEDKDYVRQLEERLKTEGFETWLDEQKITLGDSLFQKINEGLLACDYGVVVLSPTYFGKKWTKIELGALMALQTKTKKMVLPVLKDLSPEQLTEFMPILADFLSVNTSAGLDVVVQAIKSGVGGSEQQRKLSRFEQTKARLVKLNANSKARGAADMLLHSPEGVRRVRAEGNRFFELLGTQCEALTTDHFKFTLKQDFPDHYTLQGPKRYGMQFHFSEGASNVAAYAELACGFFRLGSLMHFGEREKPRGLGTRKYYPYFDASGTVVWSENEKRQETMSSDDLIAHLMEKLTDYVTTGGS